MRKVILAGTAGFCFGVDRAVNMAYRAAEENEKCCSLGPVIHNSDVTADLAEKGVRMISDPSEVKEGECVIIRAHGVSPEVYEKIVSAGGTVCDATCPFVKKIHEIVSDESSPDVPVLIAGDANHPEVIGIRGSCKGETFVFSSDKELDEIFV